VNHPALPYDKTGAFMVQLRKDPSIGAEALEFTILCGSRTAEFGSRGRAKSI